MSKSSFKLCALAVMSAGIFAVAGFWQSDNPMPNLALKTVVASTPPAPISDKSQNAESDEESKPMLQMDALKINEVGLLTSYSKVVRQLGKPKRIVKGGYNECAGGKEMTVHYPGLEIYLTGEGNQEKYEVAAVNVISSKWSVSGIRIGATLKEVQAKFSNYAYGRRIESGLEIFDYYNGDGWIVFSFRDGKLVKINWEFNFC